MHGSALIQTLNPIECADLFEIDSQSIYYRKTFVKSSALPSIITECSPGLRTIEMNEFIPNEVHASQFILSRQ